MHSIRVKITAVTIAAILTSIIALGGIGILTIGMESDQTSVENMRLLIENTEYKLDTYMDSVEQSVGMAVTWQTIRCRIWICSCWAPPTIRNRKKRWIR